VGLALTSFVMMLSVLEVGLRVVKGEPWMPGENLIARRVGLLRVHVNNDYDPVLGWVLRSNMDHPGFSTLEHGIRRNGATPRPLVEGAILASGDSFTAGSEVLDHESWPAYLEQILGVPTLNAATGGWGSDQIVLRVEQLLPVVRPSRVIVSFLVDDIERSRYRVFGSGNKPYFTVADGELVQHNQPVPPFSGRSDEIGGIRSVLGRSLLVNWTMERIGYTAWWLDGSVYKRVRHVDTVQVNALLMRRLKRELDAQGIPLTFLLQYGGGQISGWPAEPDHAQQLLTEFRAMGIECLNTWEPLRAIREQQGERALQQLYVMHDEGREYGHMSAAGNRFIAELLSEHLRRDIAQSRDVAATW
jgi:lysophospholipase L1-like esterase